MYIFTSANLDLAPVFFKSMNLSFIAGFMQLFFTSAKLCSLFRQFSKPQNRNIFYTSLTSFARHSNPTIKRNTAIFISFLLLCVYNSVLLGLSFISANICETLFCVSRQLSRLVSAKAWKSNYFLCRKTLLRGQGTKRDVLRVFFYQSLAL